MLGEVGEAIEMNGSEILTVIVLQLEIVSEKTKPNA